MSSREMLMGSEARITRLLFRDPRILRIFVMCSEEMLDPGPDFTLLFLRSVMVSIMNFVRTERDCSPTLATAGWIRRTMSFREEGSSCRSWGPESVIAVSVWLSIMSVGLTSDDLEEKLRVLLCDVLHEDANVVKDQCMSGDMEVI